MPVAANSRLEDETLRPSGISPAPGRYASTWRKSDMVFRAMTSPPIGPVDREESAIAVPLTPQQDLDLSLASHQLDFNAEIDSLSEAELRDTEFDVLVNRMVESYTVRAPAIDESEITNDVCDTNIVANARNYTKAWISNRPVSRPATRVTFFVPVHGRSRVVPTPTAQSRLRTLPRSGHGQPACFRLRTGI